MVRTKLQLCWLLLLCYHGAGETIGQCLQQHCGVLYHGCKAFPVCTKVTGCVESCQSDVECASTCFTTAMSGNASTLDMTALISLDMCGGFKQCFNYSSKINARPSTSTGRDCEAITETDAGVQYHCDLAKDGEAVMCISSKSHITYGGNQCCDGSWLWTAQASIDVHGFTPEDADSWDKKCKVSDCCAECGQGMPCFQKQLRELAKLPSCSGTVVV
mmetsp:Transcript_71083/g.123286  ORF Transcript_71083/g.123286 Transcript_71083/m.123286 type:complete len:217 (+) Transcript_71083:67-717(+)